MITTLFGTCGTVTSDKILHLLRRAVIHSVFSRNVDKNIS